MSILFRTPLATTSIALLTILLEKYAGLWGLALWGLLCIWIRVPQRRPVVIALALCSDLLLARPAGTTLLLFLILLLTSGFRGIARIGLLLWWLAASILVGIVGMLTGQVSAIGQPHVFGSLAGLLIILALVRTEHDRYKDLG